jgi:iron complex outermembrane receptor protein
MDKRIFRFNGLFLAVLATLSQLPAAHAAEQESDKQLGEMVVKSVKSAVPANLPSTTEGVSAKRVEETSNTVTAAETIQYLPSVHVRQRYIGDRNAIVQMRTNTAVSSAQTMVFADGLLLSNFTNNSFSTPPRWGMISPEEIERVDVIYGPFSALYPGNSMSGVVMMTTRMPEKFEAHAKVDYFGERFRLYGTDQRFDGHHASASVGGRSGDWSFWLSGDHLDNESHPMTFGNAIRKTTPGAAGGGTYTVVDSSRLYRDIDTTGAPRILTSSLGIEHTIQDVGKIKLAYDITPTVRATYTAGIWQNEANTRVDSYLRDAAGNTVYNAGSSMSNPFKYVRIDGLDYTVTSAAPSRSESEHWMQGFTVKSDTRGEWNWEATLSGYDQSKDVSRTATPTNGYDNGLGTIRPGGQITLNDGTGWQTLDLRGEWRPGGNRQSEHQLSFGYHYDRYTLISDTYTIASDWLYGAPGTLSTNSRGKTETQGLYLQDAWRFAPDWSLVVGGRWERWDAFQGSNYNSANTGLNPKNLVYADRSDTAFSPKAMLSLQANSDWTLRAAFGKAYRFPTVAEMFQTYTGPNNIKTNDPNLKPEQVRSAEVAAELGLPGGGLWRTSLFWEDKRDALISQTDTVSVPGTSISSIQNVDQIRTQGIETALQVNDLLINGFDLSGSVTYTDSIIQRNQRNPSVVGREQPRIPDWRATLVGVYHASDALSFSMAMRYSGRQWASLSYTDINPNVYGNPGVSSYLVFDAKVLYRVAKQWTASVGINNIGDYKYYVQPNPYPQRTFFASLKFDI